MDLTGYRSEEKDFIVDGRIKLNAFKLEERSSLQTCISIYSVSHCLLWGTLSANWYIQSTTNEPETLLVTRKRESKESKVPALLALNF